MSTLKSLQKLQEKQRQLQESVDRLETQSEQPSDEIAGTKKKIKDISKQISDLTYTALRNQVQLLAYAVVNILDDEPSEIQESAEFKELKLIFNCEPKKQTKPALRCEYSQLHGLLKKILTRNGLSHLLRGQMPEAIGSSNKASSSREHEAEPKAKVLLQTLLNGSVVVSYVHESDGRGSFVNFEGSCVVDDHSMEIDFAIEDHLWLANWTHKHLLRCTLFDGINNKTIIYEPYDLTLEEFLKLERKKGNIPIQSENIHPYGRVTFVPETYRSLIRSMIVLIVDLHKEKMCTKGFTTENMAMKDGKLKFHRLRFQKLSESDRDRDFECLKFAFERVFDGYVKDLPIDIKNVYLNFSEKRFEVKVWGDHFSLLTADEKSMFFANIRDWYSALETSEVEQVRWLPKIKASTQKIQVDHLWAIVERSWSEDGSDAEHLMRFLRNLFHHSGFALKERNKRLDLITTHLLGENIIELQRQLHITKSDELPLLLMINYSSFHGKDLMPIPKLLHQISALCIEEN